MFSQSPPSLDRTLRHSSGPLDNPIHSEVVFINSSSSKFISMLSEMYHLISHRGARQGRAEHLQCRHKIQGPDDIKEA